MPYQARELDQRMNTNATYLGVNSECVALVRFMTNAPPSGGWTRGAHVMDSAHLARGTAIATFVDGHYSGHAAIFLHHAADGIVVFDQWNGQRPHVRTIYSSGRHSFVDSAASYHVVE